MIPMYLITLMLAMCKQRMYTISYILYITCRLGYFIGLGVGAGANILTRYAVSPKFGLACQPGRKWHQYTIV